ncbi:MAG: hypothetical protein M1828_004083 [Chrysothrix sp. TS-e1954]|nr:MAG: hypothetical protein M1828_004083 [Chrysothrix sp. TS-e1954]
MPMVSGVQQPRQRPFSTSASNSIPNGSRLPTNLAYQPTASQLHNYGGSLELRPELLPSFTSGISAQHAADVLTAPTSAGATETYRPPSRTSAAPLPYSLGEVLPPRRELPFGEVGPVRRPSSSASSNAEARASTSPDKDATMRPPTSGTASMTFQPPPMSSISPTRPLTGGFSGINYTGAASTSRVPLSTLSAGALNARPSTVEGTSRPFASGASGPSRSPNVSAADMALKDYAAQPQAVRLKAVEQSILECLQDDNFWVLYEDVQNTWQRAGFDIHKRKS